MEYYLGVDVGTTNIKGLVLDRNGDEIAVSTRQTKVSYPGPLGWAEFNPDNIFYGVVDTLVELCLKVEQPQAIKAISISSMGETGVAVDSEGSWVYPAIAWFDTRSEINAQWIEREIGASNVYTITGLPISSSYGLTKLMWLMQNEPEIFSLCAKWLPIGDYIAYRLCKTQATDRTQAWRTMAYDIVGKDWSEEILSATGINKKLMPDVVSSGSALGFIDQTIASVTGLSNGCRVIAGGMDAVCGMVGVNAISPGVHLDIIGTSEIILTTMKQLKMTSESQEDSLDIGPHAIDDAYLTFGSMTASGAVVEWFANLIKGFDDNENLDTILSNLISETENEFNQKQSVLVLPHFRGSRTPYSNYHSRGVIAGLNLTTTRAHIFLAILEGLSLEGALVLNSLKRITNQRINKYWVSGGASKNPKWMSLKAQVLQKDIFIPITASISAYGAAILAAYGAGDYKSIAEAIKFLPIKHRKVSYSSDENGEEFTKYRIAYEKMYPAFLEVIRSIKN